LRVLEDELEATGKRLVIITDPHIKVDEDFFVWAEGTALDGTIDKQSRLCNTFVKDVDLEPFIGDCWPGQSQWIDYLNHGAS
jgi:alpha-glucosidase (family GH31 glycosyl hydrolase)